MVRAEVAGRTTRRRRCKASLCTITQSSANHDGATGRVNSAANSQAAGLDAQERVDGLRGFVGHGGDDDCFVRDAVEGLDGAHVRRDFVGIGGAPGRGAYEAV